jgi:hypothetical protein
MMVGMVVRYLKCGLLMVGLASITSCGSAAKNGQAAAGELAAGFTEVFCTRQLRCCSAVEISVVGGNYRTLEGCIESAVAREIQLQLAVAAPSFQNDRMTVDWRRARECLDKYAARACSPQEMPMLEIIQPRVADLLASCPGLLVGRVKVGERCDLEGECEPGARCYVPGVTAGLPPVDQGVLTSPTGQGICVRYRKQGEVCVTHTDCDPAANLACRSPDRRCGPAAPAGAPCVVSVVDGRDECDRAAHLFCDFTSQTCQRLPREGEPCSAFGTLPCDPDPTLGLSCIGAGVNGFGTCMRPGGVGTTCGAAALPVCAPQLYCRATQSDGIGVCDPLKQAGETCEGGDCGQGLVCDPQQRVCATPGPHPPGWLCQQPSECVTLACDMQFSLNKTCSGQELTVACTGGSSRFIGPPGRPDGGPPIFDAGTPFDAFPPFDSAPERTPPDRGSMGEGGPAVDGGMVTDGNETFDGGTPEDGAARSDGP